MKCEKTKSLSKNAYGAFRLSWFIPTRKGLSTLKQFGGIARSFSRKDRLYFARFKYFHIRKWRDPDGYINKTFLFDILCNSIIDRAREQRGISKKK